MVWPAIIGGAALLGAAGISSSSARSSQSRAIKAQENIAKNQYTWAVEDMERAGLNPILAAQGGIHGASASAPPAPVALNTNMDFAASARDITAALLNTEKSKNVAQDTLLKVKQTEHEGAKIAATNQQARLHFQQTRMARESVGKIMTEINHLSVSIDKMEAETQVQHAQKAHIAKMMEEIESRKALLEQQYDMLRNQIPKQKRVGDLYASWYGRLLGFIAAHMDALGLNPVAVLPIPGVKGKGAVKNKTGTGQDYWRQR